MAIEYATMHGLGPSEIRDLSAQSGLEPVQVAECAARGPEGLKQVIDAIKQRKLRQSAARSPVVRRSRLRADYGPNGPAVTNTDEPRSPRYHYASPSWLRG